jgi:hypothetical protein
MRKEVAIIEKPSLKVHINYDHITAGELGNSLIRLQAALRSIAGLSPGEYHGKYYEEQPRFVISTVHTKQSIEIELLLAILGIAMAAPGAFYMWHRFASDVFRWFKAAILHMGPELEGLKIEVTKGKIDIEASRTFLDRLTKRNRATIETSVWALIVPARRVEIRDDESEILIEWSEEDD